MFSGGLDRLHSWDSSFHLHKPSFGLSGPPVTCLRYLINLCLIRLDQEPAVVFESVYFKVLLAFVDQLVLFYFFFVI